MANWNDFIGESTRSLGLSEGTARSGTGGILQMVRLLISFRRSDGVDGLREFPDSNIRFSVVPSGRPSSGPFCRRR